MKLLILTQYFPPEVGAPQSRLYEVALRLKKKGVDVTVLTAMPNYPQMVIHPAYKGKHIWIEQVHRAMCSSGRCACRRNGQRWITGTRATRRPTMQWPASVGRHRRRLRHAQQAADRLDQQVHAVDHRDRDGGGCGDAVHATPSLAASRGTASISRRV